MVSNAHGGPAAETRSLGVPLLLLAALCLTLPAGLAAQARAPIVAVPQDAAAGTDDFYYLDLANGTVLHGDQLRRNPLQIRVQRVRQNLFAEIGRPTNQPAAVGEVLLVPIHFAARSVRAVLFVETSTGYVAFFDQLGKGGTFGRITSAIGRPFSTLAAADGNFALLPRHDTNGRTVGAYLYHAGSGRAFYLAGLNRLDTDRAAVAAAGFPRLTGRVAAAEIQSFDRTVSYLVVDGGDGSLRFLDVDGDNQGRVSVRGTTSNLFPTFAADAASSSPERFVAVPIRDSRETTTHVLFVDGATGDLAVFDGMEDDARAPRARKLAANLYGALGTSAAGERICAAVPAVAGNGATSGVWLIDSRTRAVAYVADPASPTATIRRVDVGN
ncbi:MAG: hypothetical protein GY719_35765 [bacterium]|nr:hypothetical protein [bacterium]